MARTKQTARRSTGGNAPRKQLPTLSAEEAAERAAVEEAARASTRWEKVRAAVRVRKYAIAWQEHVAELVCAPNGSGRRADLAAYVADFGAA